MDNHDKIIHALTEYDRKQSGRKYYNPNALGLYFQAAHNVKVELATGKTIREALCCCFNDRLLDVCLKAVGEEPARPGEAR